MENEDESNYLKYTLKKEFFISRDEFYKNLLSKCTKSEHRNMCLLNRVYQGNDFINKIKNEKIINKYYESTLLKLQNGPNIKTLENGLFVYGGKLLLYCVKDEKKEDEYISDINNIKCIKHEEYDKSISNLNKENSQNKDTKIFRSDSKYLKDMMTGLKNRALVLESFVNFYFRQFKILPLPNLIMNLDYISNDKNKPDNLIN